MARVARGARATPSDLVDSPGRFERALDRGIAGARLIVIENGEVIVNANIDAHATPPIPPGHARPVAERREAFTLACFDRLRVLTTELKRLVAADVPVALRLGVAPPLADVHLASALWWV